MNTLLNAIAHPRVTLQGMWEFRSSLGMTYGDSRDEAYDFGRELAHRATLRTWDESPRDFCYECDKVTVWKGEFCAGCGREWGYPL